MRRRTIAVVTLAFLALTGCSKAPEPATAPAPSSTVSTPTVSTTSETPTVEPTTDEPTPEPSVEETVEVPEASFSFACNNYSEDATFTSLAAAWKYDGDVYECSAETIGFAPTPAMSAAAAAYLKLGSYSEGESQSEALDEMLGICAAKDIGAEELLSDRYKPMVPFTLKVCPAAPHAKLMKLVAAGDVFIDGTYEVGVDVKPGTYRTEGKMTDCYWERSTKGGDTIANDFVSNAPAGVTVRIRTSDGGFKADNCGMWTRMR